MIYLDSSALLKLVRPERETPALRAWLAARLDEPLITSELGRVEVLRASRRLGAALASVARTLLGDVDLVPLDRSVQDLSCEVGGAVLRTLDALHLASAVMLGDDLTCLVAYDKRLLAAARDAGLGVASPGA